MKPKKKKLDLAEEWLKKYYSQGVNNPYEIGGIDIRWSAVLNFAEYLDELEQKNQKEIKENCMKSKRKLLEQMVDDVQLQILGNEVNTRTLKKKVENNDELERAYADKLVQLSQEREARIEQLDTLKEMLEEADEQYPHYKKFTPYPQ